jgi:integrase
VDRKYLEWHGQQYRVQVKVPPNARPILGKARLVKPLHTDSLATANRLKHRIVAEFKEQIARAEIEARRKSRQEADPLIEEALNWRAAIEEEKERPVECDEDGVPIEVAAADVLGDRAAAIEEAEGPERAILFAKIAQGLATPIMALVDAWIAERAHTKPRQQIDYRRAVSKFAAWLSEAKLPSSIEAVSRKIAGRYVSEAMVAKSVHWKTANKDVSALSVYWKWLVKKGHCETNVWTGQSLPKIKPKGEDQKPKRPYTDDEVARLMRGIDNPLILDAAMVAALSGMRTDEIARTKVADCAGGVFRVTDAKTTAGIRDVPIHPDLRQLVARRSRGKGPQEYLFHELKDPPPGSAMERGQGITKRFVTIRRKLGVDERLPGRRQSRIDFHSFRRWFIRKAIDALHKGAKGYDPWTIADVVGHDREATEAGLGMTMGRYPGDAPLAAKKACVAAVKLPRKGSARK